eukprot:5547791-Amphidinium_carterae.1
MVDAWEPGPLHIRLLADECRGEGQMLERVAIVGATLTQNKWQDGIELDCTENLQHPYEQTEKPPQKRRN